MRADVGESEFSSDLIWLLDFGRIEDEVGVDLHLGTVLGGEARLESAVRASGGLYMELGRRIRLPGPVACVSSGLMGGLESLLVVSSCAEVLCVGSEGGRGADKGVGDGERNQLGSFRDRTARRGASVSICSASLFMRRAECGGDCLERCKCMQRHQRRLYRDSRRAEERGPHTLATSMVQWTSTQRGHKQLLNSSCPDDSHAKGSNNSFGGAEEKLKDERPRMLRKRD